MTDNELLLALSDMFDKKLTPIDHRLSSLESKVDKLDSRVSSLESKVDNLESKVDRLDSRVTNIELSLENNVVPRLQNIESCYTTTYNRYQNSVEGYDAMQNDVNILKTVVREHSEKLQHVS